MRSRKKERVAGERRRAKDRGSRGSATWPTPLRRAEAPASGVSLAEVEFRVDTERALVDPRQVRFHVVTSTEDALADRTPGLPRVQVLVQCQRHRMLETLPTNSTAKQ